MLRPKSVILQEQHQAVWISCWTFFLCLSWCKLGGMAHRERVQTLFFKWRSTSLLFVSWLFGTLTVKAKVFFVHRYWFIQLLLSKCFYSALLLLFLSELTRYYSKVLCTLTLSCRDTNKAKHCLIWPIIQTMKTSKSNWIAFHGGVVILIFSIRWEGGSAPMCY